MPTAKPTDPIQSFFEADMQVRLKMALDPKLTTALEGSLGKAALAELQGLAKNLDTSHLGIHSPKNLIFVPGVMGSLLHSGTQGGVWWIDVRSLKRVDQLRLAPDGKGDADPNIQVAPFTTDATYMPFLQAVLQQDELGHVLFPYDWRRPLSASTEGLKTLVDNLYAGNGGKPVHLVAHSMGGLVVRATLMEYPGLWPRIGRIAFIGTPHFGSPAIAGYLKNHLWGFELLAVLGTFLSPATFRSLWGVLNLLPAPLGVYPGTRPGDADRWKGGDPQDPYPHPCANFDLYDAGEWRLEKLDAAGVARLQAILDATADFHRKLYQAHQALTLDRREKMLMVAGVGKKGLFRLERQSGWKGLWKEINKVTDRVSGDRHRDGDGRVSRAAAELDGVAVRYVKGVHGGLPNIPAVTRDVIRWLTGQPMVELYATADEALSWHLAAGEEESAAPSLDGGSLAAGLKADDPGLWAPEAPPPARLAELRQRAESGDLPELSQVKLL